MQDSPRTARFGLKIGQYALLALGIAFSAGCDDVTNPSADMGMGGEGGGAMGGMGGTPVGGMGGQGGDTGTPCLGEDECPTGQYCDIDEGDFSGICREGCNDADDCADGQECNTATNVCGDPGCDGDADCPDGRCAEGACVDSDCSSERACDADGDGRPQQCNEDDGTCAPLFACCAGEGECSMALAGECPEGAEQLDDAVTCEDSPCGRSCTPETEGADCAMSEFCNADTNRCQEGCRLEAASCPDGESCDSETRECTPQPCVGSDDCNAYQFCDEIVQVCADGCQSDDDCPRDGEICDGGECIERCDSDEVGACGEGEYCSPITETCEENCDEHSDCADNEACNPVNNQCEQNDCRDDLGEGGEPNNDEATATVIDMGEPDAGGIRAGSADGRVVCGDDVDVFAVTLRQAERMRIRLVFDDNEDLNFRLSGDEVGDEPIVVATAQAPEELFFPGENDVRNETTYYITVYPGRAARDGVGYSLEIIAFDTLRSCLPDALEDNDDAASATIIGNANPYSVDELNICEAQDPDWFLLPLVLNSGVRVEVVTDGDQPPMTIAMYSQGRIDGVGGGGPEYDVVVAEGRAGRVAYVMDIPADNGAFSNGNWYIRVGSSDPEATSTYAINVRVVGGPECIDDGYEDNDGVAGGTDLASIDGVGANGEVPYSDEGIEVPAPDDNALQICTFDDDYYCLDLEAGDRLEGWAQGEVAGEVRVRIVDSDGRNVGADGLLVGANAENPIPAELVGALEGRYCVVVDGQGAAQGPYRFWVRRVAVADLCEEDPELVDGVNNTADTATTLIDIEPMLAPNRRFEYRNALICGNEDDWYEFEVAERRSRVCVMVDGFRNDNADLDIELFRTQGGPGQACARTAECDPGTHCISGVCRASIESSEGEFDSEQISVGKRIIGNNNGEYKLRVFRGAAGDDSAYRVLATVTPEDEVCGPDWQERASGANQNAAQAIDLGQGQASICDTWLCHEDDEDFYRFIVPAGQDRTVFIEYANQDDGRIFMDVTGTELDGDPDFGGFRRSADPAGDHQCVNLRGGAEDQEVVIRLFGNIALPDGDDRVDYSLRIVPTDLSDLNPANPQAGMEQGECVTLGGGELGSCPFDNPFADGCWPHMDLE